MEDGSVVTWGTGPELSVGCSPLALAVVPAGALCCSQGKRLRRRVGQALRPGPEAPDGCPSLVSHSCRDACPDSQCRVCNEQFVAVQFWAASALSLVGFSTLCLVFSGAGASPWTIQTASRPISISAVHLERTGNCRSELCLSVGS